jgi:sulfur-oxidizing protein SoxZ
MAIQIRVREADDGSTDKEIIALFEHPMHTGTQKDKETGKIVPAHFIQRIVLEHNGRPVIEAFTGAGMAADPLLTFRLKGAKNGDKVRISWWDNRKKTESAEKTISL